jgi:flavin reductase (DIM6/NTAB) family NADH-FMN oxidoreductase RutF
MTPSAKEVDPRHFREVMGQFASGVTVITTLHDGEIRGMTANAFMSGSLEPPLCVISVAKRARTHVCLQETRRFVVNILAHDQSEVAIHFSGRPSPKAMIEIGRIDGIPMLQNVCAHLAADIVAEHDCGDHTLFIGHLFHMDADASRDPLVYHEGRFGTLVHTKQDQLVPAPEFW